MAWLSRICFSALLAAVPASPADVTGQVELTDSRDPGVRKARDFSSVVVWMEPTSGAPHQATTSTFTLLQKGKKFIPHVLAVPVGATVDFPNADPIFHNAFSNFSGQPFDTGLYPPGTSRRITFRRAGVVRVFCNIHATMSAVIVVVSTPHFAVTAKNGTFRLTGVAPGEYLFKIWHERSPVGKLAALERRVQVGADGLAVPLIRISESGWLELPHTNKYGKEYPASPPEHVLYPGGRK
jgi:plastocyanin